MNNKYDYKESLNNIKASLFDIYEEQEKIIGLEQNVEIKNQKVNDFIGVKDTALVLIKRIEELYDSENYKYERNTLPQNVNTDEEIEEQETVTDTEESIEENTPEDSEETIEEDESSNQEEDLAGISEIDESNSEQNSEQDEEINIDDSTEETEKQEELNEEENEEIEDTNESEEPELGDESNDDSLEQEKTDISDSEDIQEEISVDDSTKDTEKQEELNEEETINDEMKKYYLNCSFDKVNFAYVPKSIYENIKKNKVSLDNNIDVAEDNTGITEDEEEAEQDLNLYKQDEEKPRGIIVRSDQYMKLALSKHRQKTVLKEAKEYRIKEVTRKRKEEQKKELEKAELKFDI